MAIQLRKDDFQRFAPRARKEYTETLFANLDKIRAAGLLETRDRWCHFVAQCSAETDGFVIVRESLNYRSVKAIRNAWSSRASKHSDEWIVDNLIGKPVALGDWAYGGREGNVKGTSDGYDFRGGMWLQTTHRNAVEAYCKKLGVPVRSDCLDDPVLTLQFALLEWTEGRCNDYADRDDVLSISKIINTGSARSNVKPNGMDRRRQELDRARRIWGNVDELEPEPVRPFPEVVPASPAKVATKSKSVWALITAAGAWAADKLESVFHFIPTAGEQVDSLMAPIASISNALKWNLAGITGAVAIGCIVLAIVRHARDKAELTTLKGE